MDKATLRAHVRGQGRVEESKQALVRQELFSWLSSRLPGTVSAFLAMPGEVDLSPLFEQLPGWRWVLPRIEQGRQLSFRDKDIPREEHPFGMSQPVGQGPAVPIHEIDVFLTPGLAFDYSGGRVGNGGGYYDRVLAQRRRDSVAIGVTIESRIFEDVPMQDHDQRVDWLASENGVRECSTTRRAGPLS